MLTIHLHNVQFFAHHGLFEHETVNGNHFELNCHVQYHPPKLVKHIEETINYASVFSIIENRMKVATPLLETVVMDIANEILQQFSLAEEVFVHLVKINPPIENFQGGVGVSYLIKRN
jgi:7,8-dihydroneopterin aldolase/epimerase/oxygenase